MTTMTQQFITILMESASVQCLLFLMSTTLTFQPSLINETQRIAVPYIPNVNCDHLIINNSSPNAMDSFLEQSAMLTDAFSGVFIPVPKVLNDASVQYILMFNGGMLSVRNSGYSITFACDQSIISPKGSRQQTHASVLNNYCAHSDDVKAVDAASSATRRIDIEFVNAENVVPVGGTRAPGVCNFYLGNDPSKWSSGVAQYRNITYSGLYRGIDINLTSHFSNIVKYDVYVAPYASLDQFEARYVGVDSLSINELNNSLTIRVGSVTLCETAPVAWQETSEGRQSLDVRFVQMSSCSFGFKIANDYDESLFVIIDPQLLAIYYIGGSNKEQGRAIAFDENENIYLVGRTFSDDFVGANGNYGGSADAYIVKITKQGNLRWSTFIGG